MSDFSISDKEFTTKYKKEIEGISKYNNVDLSVAKSMFQANLKNQNGTYKGGGVAENWGEMTKDYNNLVEDAKESIKGKTTRNASGETVNQEDLITEKKK